MAQIIRFPVERCRPSAPVAKAAPKPCVVDYQTTKGGKVDRDLDVSDVAKLVRKDIKAALKSGALPKGTKCRVRISRFSMGCSLSVDVTACDELLANVAWWASDLDPWEKANAGLGGLLSEAGEAVQATLEGIVKAYNEKTVEHHTDYYVTNFFEHVDIDHALLRTQAAAHNKKASQA